MDEQDDFSTPAMAVRMVKLEGSISALTNDVRLFFDAQKEVNSKFEKATSNLASKGQFTWPLFLSFVFAFIAVMTPATAVIKMYVSGNSALHTREDKALTEKIESLTNQVNENRINSRSLMEIRSLSERNTLDLERVMETRWSSDMETLRHERNIAVFEMHKEKAKSNQEKIEALKSELMEYRFKSAKN